MNDDAFASHPYMPHLHCLKDNYQAYVKAKYGDIEIGFTSVEEQIADAFGVFNALYAYEKLAANSSGDNGLVDALLPRLAYTQKQLFLIRHAESYCRKKDFESIMFDAVHAIHDYRAFQTSLFGEFGRAFECGRRKNKYSIAACDIFEMWLLVETSAVNC